MLLPEGASNTPQPPRTDVLVAAQRGIVQRRGAVVVQSVDVGAGGDQRLGHLRGPKPVNRAPQKGLSDPRQHELQ